MVTRVVVDDRTGAVTGVNYLRAGREHYQRARAVAVAGYSIETPRLLLLSATDRYPHGSGQRPRPGRPLPDGAGRTRRPPAASTTRSACTRHPRRRCRREQFYETDPTKPYKRGWSIQTVSPLPITWAEHVAAQGHWGAPLREYMRDYVHWATLGALCEYLPQPDNRVTLAEEKDRHGLPVAHFSYSQCDNDKQLTKAATASMEDDPERRRRRGGHDHRPLRPPRRRGPAWPPAPRTVSSTPTTGCSASPNLYVVDGSALPTQGAANPALTIMALAARAADRLIRLGRRGLTEQQQHRMIDRHERAARRSTTSPPPSTVPDSRTRGRRHAELGCHHRRHRHPARRRCTPAWAGPTPAPPPPRSSIDHLADVVHGRDAYDIAAGWEAMHRACRNFGTRGLVMQALSAVDIAWWDLKARLLDVPLTDLFGADCRDACRSTAPAASPP